MDILYSTKVTAAGGRHGRIRSEDGILDLDFAVPTELGGPGGATNSVQLLAGGYAACFGDSLLRVALQLGHRFTAGDLTVVAEIGLSCTEPEVFVLHASLAVTIAGVDQTTAETLVAKADAICPYTYALRGNIDIVKTVTAR
ncbi:Ohr family peroxiredoxin [Mesorhizobium sp. KR9-304]|uniref:Ohr family peroxiredoxin n=1 Tax=Mesorhizobium sp. KR9-304 TaxID=3156614 RepID=UPI0032B3C4BF